MNPFRVQTILLGIVPAMAQTPLPGAQASLIINGKVAVTDVRTPGGSAYVKISGVAKAPDQQRQSGHERRARVADGEMRAA